MKLSSFLHHKGGQNRLCDSCKTGNLSVTGAAAWLNESESRYSPRPLQFWLRMPVLLRGMILYGETVFKIQTKPNNLTGSNFVLLLIEWPDQAVYSTPIRPHPNGPNIYLPVHSQLRLPVDFSNDRPIAVACIGCLPSIQNSPGIFCSPRKLHSSRLMGSCSNRFDQLQSALSGLASWPLTHVVNILISPIWRVCSPVLRLARRSRPLSLLTPGSAVELPEHFVLSSVAVVALLSLSRLWIPCENEQSPRAHKTWLLLDGPEQLLEEQAVGK